MYRKIIDAVFLIFLLVPLSSAHGSEIRAFHNVNQLPLKQIFGLPSLDNSPLIKKGQWRMNGIANISNTYNVSANANDQLTTDVETFRGSLKASYGLRDNWQIGIEVPYVSHDAGFLDGLIYDWHDFFGMPQNGRTKDNSDQFQLSYLSGSGASFELPDPASGLGDIRINGVYSRPWHNRVLVFSTELKLATGDYDKLTGSGGYDFSVGLTLNDPHSLGKYRITMYGGLAGIYLGDMDGALSEVQKNFAIAGRAGIGWQATKLIQLKLQFDAQSALYDSDLKELGGAAVQLVMGGSLTFTDSVYLDISVAEDIKTSTAADVAFQLALVATF